MSSSLLSGQSAFRSEEISGRRETYDVMLCNRGGSVRSEGGSASAVESFGPFFFGHSCTVPSSANKCSSSGGIQEKGKT